MTSSSFHGLQFPFHGEEIEVVRGSSIGGGPPLYQGMRQN